MIKDLFKLKTYLNFSDLIFKTQNIYVFNCSNVIFKTQNRFVFSLNTNQNSKLICIFIKYISDFFNHKTDVYFH